MNQPSDTELTTIQYILSLHAQGWTPEAIARKLSEKTVIKYADLLDLVRGVIAADEKGT